MILLPTPIETFADRMLRPCAMPFVARNFHDHVTVAGGTQRNIQPGNFLLQPKPFRIGHERREEGNGRAQAGNRYADLVHGLGIAGACAAVMRLDALDAAKRDLLECGRAIVAGCRDDLAPSAGRSGWLRCHRHSSPGESMAARALRSDCSGAPEASTMCQSTAPVAKVSCIKATSRVASDASPLRCSIRESRVA